MKQYFYTPKHYETLIAENVSNYLSNNGDFTIITGVYKETQNIIDNSNNIVYSKLRTGDIIFIKNGYNNSFDNKNYELIGFCLEGNFEKEVPEVYQYILTLEDCFVFNTNIEYLAFLKQITQLS